MVIRNLALQPVKVSGKVTWRGLNYPCTLEQCCAEDADCCSTEYGRNVESRDFCRKCNRGFEPGTCQLNEASELPSWSARGPAVSGSNTAYRRVKPDLVAPGQMIVCARSDRFLPSIGVVVTADAFNSLTQAESHASVSPASLHGTLSVTQRI